MGAVHYCHNFQNRKTRAREASDKASSQAFLFRLQVILEAAGSVWKKLQSFVASHSEQDFGCKYSETIKLPNSHLTQRQPQPSQVPLSRQSRTEGRGSREEQSPATKQREKLPVIQPMPSTADISPLSRCIVKEGIENAVSKVREKEHEEPLLECAKSLTAWLKQSADNLCLSVQECLCLSSSDPEDGKLEQEVAGCWASHWGSKSLCSLAPSLSSAGQSWGKR